MAGLRVILEQGQRLCRLPETMTLVNKTTTARTKGSVPTMSIGLCSAVAAPQDPGKVGVEAAKLTAAVTAKGSADRADVL